MFVQFHLKQFRNMVRKKTIFGGNGSVALLWRNSKYNVNPGLSYFERCLLACARLLANLHFRQSKAWLPLKMLPNQKSTTLPRPVQWYNDFRREISGAIFFLFSSLWCAQCEILLMMKVRLLLACQAFSFQINHACVWVFSFKAGNREKSKIAM